MNTKQKLIGIPLAAVAILAGGAAAGYTSLASAQTPPATQNQNQNQTGTPPWHERGEHMGPGMGQGKGRGVMGTVSAVNGNTITVTNEDGTSYTVDASSAKVSKVVELSVSDIKVGDTVGVQGAVSGNSVTAKHIMDGVPPRPADAPQE